MSAIIHDLPELRHPPVNAPPRRRGLRAEISHVHEHSTAVEAAPAVGRPRASVICLRFVLTTAPLLACDVLSLCVCGLLALGILRFVAPGIWGQLSLWTPLALAALSLGYWPGGLYPGIGVHPVLEVRQLTKVNTIGLLAAAVAGYLTHRGLNLAAFCVAAWIIALVLVPFCRIVVRKLCARRNWWGFPALVISSGQAAERVIRTLLDSPQGGLRPAAVVDPTDQGPVRVECLPTLDSASVGPFMHDHAIRFAVVSLPELSRREVTEVLEFYSSRIPHVIVVSNLFELPSLWSTARSCGGLNGMEFHNGLMLFVPRVVKRLIDVTVTISALLAASPLFAVLSLLIKLTSRGPVFYGHKRLGLQGRPFKAWKFRSMYCDGDRILKEHLAANPAAREEWERDQKLRDDPRVTPIGKLLRRLSLDELPQLWNVLRGDMSLVGPRPIVNDEIVKYGRVFHLYTGVKPGITGLWQVSGRNHTTYPQRVRIDQYYVRNWSPWLDVYILCKTISVVLKREGAY